MIADTAVLPGPGDDIHDLLSGSWIPHIYDDCSLSHDALADLGGITTLDDDLCSVSQQSVVPDFSVESSVASSECGSEDLFSDVTSDLHSNIPRRSEDLSYPLLSAFTEESDDIVFGREMEPLHWSDSELELSQLTHYYSDSNSDRKKRTDHRENVTQSVTCSPVSSPVRKKRKKRVSRSKPLTASCSSLGEYQSTQPWSCLSVSDQMSVVHDLTEIISQKMGLREQLDIIRIISPEAKVSAVDTQFVVDLETLNDDKLQRVRDYIRAQSRGPTAGSAGVGISSDSCSECNSTVSAPPATTQGRKKQRRQRKTKEEKQLLKEEKSGLFRNESVLSLSVATPEQAADVDIDILT